MDFEEFFGIPKKASAEQVKAAVEKKEAELDNLKTNLTKRESQMIDALEKLCILPNSRDQPGWSEKREKESGTSILDTWVKLSGMKVPEEKKDE